MRTFTIDDLIYATRLAPDSFGYAYEVVRVRSFALVCCGWVAGNREHAYAAALALARKTLRAKAALPPVE